MKNRFFVLLFLLVFVFTCKLIGKNNSSEQFKEEKSICKKNETLVNVQISFLGGELSVSGLTLTHIFSNAEVAETAEIRRVLY